MEGSMEKEQVNDIEKVLSTKPRPPKNGGGWRTMPFIIGNETFEKLASMSLIANLVVYLRTQYNLDGISAVTIFAIWAGTCNIAPLLGAFISDAYIGKFRTLIYGSLTSTLGMVALSMTAAIPGMKPKPCVSEVCEQATGWQLGFLYFGLGLIVIGAGGIRPCNIAFGVDQFDTSTEKGKKNLESFYNWYYLSFTIALLFALTVVVYVQNSVSWAIGLAMPAGFMAFSVLVFILGNRRYVHVKPEGSVFVDIAKVIVAAFRKRRLNNGMEYNTYKSSTGETTTVLTEKFKCFDKAAIVTERDAFDDKGAPVNGWRLCSVEKVEDLKSLMSIMPVWVSGLTSFIIMDQQSTFGVQQAMQMDTHLIGSFQVPPGSLGLTCMIALAIYIPIYERVILPLSRKFTQNGITLQDRMRGGILMSMLCMLVSGFVETKRRAAAMQHNTFVAPLSFAWLLPQFAFSGLTEALMGIALMEFFNSQLPKSMRTVAGAFVFLNLSVASYINSLIVNLISHSGLNWLGGRDLNNNKLDNYYFMIVGLAVLNYIYFVTYASHYIINKSGDESEDKASASSDASSAAYDKSSSAAEESGKGDDNVVERRSS